MGSEVSAADYGIYKSRHQLRGLQRHQPAPPHHFGSAGVLYELRVYLLSFRLSSISVLITGVLSELKGHRDMYAHKVINKCTWCSTLLLFSDMEGERQWTGMRHTQQD